MHRCNKGNIVHFWFTRPTSQFRVFKKNAISDETGNIAVIGLLFALHCFYLKLEKCIMIRLYEKYVPFSLYLASCLQIIPNPGILGFGFVETLSFLLEL